MNIKDSSILGISLKLNVNKYDISNKVENKDGNIVFITQYPFMKLNSYFPNSFLFKMLKNHKLFRSDSKTFENRNPIQ